MRLFVKSFVFRGFSFKPNNKIHISDDDLLSFFKQKFVQDDSIKVMPQSELVKLVSEFYKNYPVVRKHPELERKLQEALTTRIKSMSLNEGLSVIDSLTVKSRFSAEIQKTLNSELLAFVLLHKSSFNINNLRTVSHLIKTMASTQSFNEEIFEELLNEFSAEDIEKLDAENLSILCDLLSNIGMQNKYFDIKLAGEISIYKLIEDKFMRIINSMQLKNLFSVLKCLVINDRGDEDLIRKAEKKVFSHLLLFEDKQLSDVPYFYHKRIMFPNDYLIDTVYKPLYNEFTRRFENVNPLSKSLFLVNYWKNSTFHGMYCDNQLSDKIKKEMNLGVYDNLTNYKLKQHMLTACLSYMAHARQLDERTIEDYVNIVKGYKNTFDDFFFMRSAIYLSRYSGINPVFWEIFSTKFKRLSANLQYHEQLYPIWLNCTLKDPETKEIMSKLYTDPLLKSMSEKWKNLRERDLVKNESSHKHKETIKILKDKNVKFETEYFNNYYIDIAFPDYKIGLELSGPGHYLFPALILNGRSENRKQTLEKLGWKIHFYPYFFRPENDDGIVNFLNGILPLDF